MKEYYYDKLLNIRTRGKKEDTLWSDGLHYYPYEPTSYHALEALTKHYEINKEDRFVDFGCGKGRLPLFLHHYFGVSAVGIEMDSILYDAAIHNKESYSHKHGNADNVQFYCGYAEEYEPQALDNRFYFFNPFSVDIFKQVIHKLADFYQGISKEIDIILYYASEEYVSFLQEETNFERKKEIRVPFLYYMDRSERFLIYRLHSLK